jgi:hypothetical protein
MKGVKMTYLEKMLEQGYEYICVFCSQEFVDKPYYCGGCDEYKGIVDIEDYIQNYGDT